MKSNSRSLHQTIWIYLAIFSCFILIFLWLAQGLFFDKYYELNKSKELSKSADKIIDSYNNKDNFIKILEGMSYNDGICIDVVIDDYTYYKSTGFNHGCMIDINSDFKLDFEKSSKIKESYILINPRFNNKTMVYAIKLDYNSYAYISVSLKPLDAATLLLKKQLVIISIFIMFLSVIVAFYISKKISRPIEIMSQKANDISAGNYNSSFITNTEINELKALENNLNFMRDEFIKTEELRRDLMANVGHDLKTPLTMIKAYAEMVKDLTYNNEEKRNDNLNTIIDECERLNLLVNDILVLSNIQSNTNELKYKNFSLDELISSIIKRYDILVEQENYQFIYKKIENSNVCADYKRIEQVIYNILNNAINYTGEDKKIYITLIDKLDSIRVEIKDTGKGIKEEEIKHIWNKYYHSEKKHKRNVVGTGLGLSIVENILKQHNFPYGVISMEGKGTTFYFEIKKNIIK